VDLQNGKSEERTGSNRYVGVPGMNAICKHIAANLTVQTQTRITSLTRDTKWTVASEEESFGDFDAVVVAIPAVQAAELLSGVSKLADTIAKVEMTPCWTTMLAFETPIDVSFDAALVHDSAIAWMARNSSKPSRPASTDGWVVQASAEWSKGNLERDAADVAAELLAEFLRLVEHPLRVPTHNVAHRWRYAFAAAPLGAESLLDRELSLAICGDWCLGNRVEHAFLSGLSAAEATSRCIGVRPRG
ncbi:MAG: NAD(P)/FAD-dependent oxidoreductase, partial [Planctomycetaceae bacterium]